MLGPDDFSKAVNSGAYRRNGCVYAALIRSRLQRALGAHIERVDRGAAADEQTVSERAAKDQVGARLRQVDLAQQIPRRAVTTHTSVSEPGVDDIQLFLVR